MKHLIAAVVLASLQSGEPMRLASADGPFVLGAAPLRVSLTPADTRSMASRIRSLERDERLLLVLRGLSVEQQPAIVFQVYFDLPERATPDDAHRAGTLNFFRVQPGSSSNPSDLFETFDVTDVAKRLDARRLLREPIAITIVPVGEPASGARACIRRIELVQQ